MPKRIEVPVGTRFGRLTVTGEGEPSVSSSGNSRRRMECDCDCGGEVTAQLNHLRFGRTQSCGCFKNEAAAERHTTHGQAGRGKLSSNYKLWASIKPRAVTGSATCAHNYLGRGITMYWPWIDNFVAFDAWVTENLGERPVGQTLDRIDNYKSYEPGNLRWATVKEQNNNKRGIHRITHLNETMTISEWADRHSLSRATLWRRLFEYNWPIEKALTTPVRSRKNAD